MLQISQIRLDLFTTRGGEQWRWAIFNVVL